ncbi:hypothetical protein [Amycolatopsis sp. NPDC051102]|uniref:hypothetical protein n=1 Tax=Amycolatopsis sp. NPDC051102 TaxID=3155163 RepID=UPI0034146E77
MVSLSAGMVMNYNHKKVVILRTGLSIDGSEAVKVAPLTTRKPGSGRHVEAKTLWGTYWIPLGQVSDVKAAGVGYAGYGPGRLSKKLLNAVLRELDKGSQ